MTITSVEDLRELAKRRVPRMFYDYVDSGSWTGSTYRRNSSDLHDLRLNARVGVDISQRSLATTMLGVPVTMPVALAPTGLCGMQHADGEILAARAAAAQGVPFTLSTMSICSIEDVARHSPAPFWFQLYMMRDRAFIERLIERARAAGCSALMLTVDLQLPSLRFKDVKNGLTTPPKPTLRNLVNMATRPRWCAAMLRTPRRTFGNIVGHVPGAEALTSVSKWAAEQFEPALSWNDVEWVKRRWQGPLIVKGILDPRDARAAMGSGADAVVVSNHGGRQLDGAVSTIHALPAVAHAVGSSAEVWLDGGVQSGQDVLKALALGARATLIGRAYLYGLGAMGEPGVELALKLIRRELETSMAFCGKTRVADIGPDVVAGHQRGSLGTS